MKYTLTFECETFEELSVLVNHIDPQDKPRFTTADEIAKAFAQADFQSLANTTVEEEKPAIPEPVPAPVPETAGFRMSRDEVKTYCTVARTEKGVNIKQILQSLGVNAFKDLPDNKLEALYDAVKSARGD